MLGRIGERSAPIELATNTERIERHADQLPRRSWEGYRRGGLWPCRLGFETVSRVFIRCRANVPTTDRDRWTRRPVLDIATATWLALGFGLGLVHAFDADHVMALSVFASRKRGVSQGMRTGLRWSLGHGLVLMAAGVGLLFLGRALPKGFTIAAERGVGVVMIAIGAWAFFELMRNRGHLHFHEHDDLLPHAHWHSHAGNGSARVDDPQPVDSKGRHRELAHRHEHGPLFVGGLHGLAGSAPILAVLPAAARSPMLGIGYLLLFALGVSLAMAIVSGALGHVVGRLQRRSDGRRLAGLRAISASGSIALGVWMLALG
jgi:nickel/cobalt exporter